MPKTKAIVLKKIPYAESDLIVDLLTEEGTRLTVFAPKAKVSVKRFAGTLDVFNYLEIEYQEGKGNNLYRLQSAELIMGMEGVRGSLLKFAASCYFAEIVIEFLQEKDKLQGLFRAFHHFLTGLNDSAELPNHVIPLMEHRFLDLLGFRPTLNECLTCKTSLVPEGEYFFDGVKGGIVCAPCAEAVSRALSKPGPGYGSYPLRYSTIQKILTGYEASPESWNRQEWKGDEVKETRQALEFFIQYTAGKPLKSLQFLSKIFE